MINNVNNLINENSNLIHSLSYKFESYHNKDDLYQVGVIGLINAYKNFDDAYGVKFTTYAYPYIVGEMKKLVREDKGIKISRNFLKLNLKINKAIILLSQKLMRSPTYEEIAEYLEVPEYLVAKSLNISNLVQSLDEPIVNSDSKELNLYDTIPNIETMDLDSLIALRDELKKLDSIDHSIIKMRYYDGLTQTEVAQNIGINQVQVSRQEQKILQKLRTKLDV